MAMQRTVSQLIPTSYQPQFSNTTKTHMYTDFPSDRSTGRSVLTDRNFYTTIWMLLPPNYNQPPPSLPSSLLPSSSSLSPRLYQKFAFSKVEEPLQTSTNSRWPFSSSLLHRHSTRRKTVHLAHPLAPETTCSEFTGSSPWGSNL